MGYNQIMVAQVVSQVMRKLGVDVTGKKITWDGNTAGLPVIEPLGYPMVRVSNQHLPTGVVKVTFSNGNTQILTAEEALPGCIGIVASNTILAFSAPTGEFDWGNTTIVVPESGTYFMFSKEFEYVTSVSNETIHPIDPKYLPGVCLPVVELSTEIDIENSDAQPLNADDTAKFKAIAESPSAFVVKTKMGEVDIIGTPSGVAFFMGELQCSFECTVNGIIFTYSFAPTDDGGYAVTVKVE